MSTTSVVKTLYAISPLDLTKTMKSVLLLSLLHIRSLSLMDIESHILKSEN